MGRRSGTVFSNQWTVKQSVDCEAALCVPGMLRNVCQNSVQSSYCHLVYILFKQLIHLYIIIQGK